MKYKLAMFDIDGTIVNDKREMLPITREQLERIHDAGLLMGFASGRPIDKNLFALPSRYGLNFDFDVFIGMNGGQVYIKDQDWSKGNFKLQKNEIKEIIDFMRPLDLNPFVYSDDGNMMCQKEDEMMKASSMRNLTKIIIVKEEELYKKDTNKILYRIPDDKSADYITEFGLKHCEGKNYTCFQTTKEMVEFQDKRVNKGVALKTLAEQLNISLDEIIAFGDNSNDREMLEYAGGSICLINGSNDAKAVSKIVTDIDNNNDGLGKYLQQHFDEIFAD